MIYILDAKTGLRFEIKGRHSQYIFRTDLGRPIRKIYTSMTGWHPYLETSEGVMVTL